MPWAAQNCQVLGARAFCDQLEKRSSKKDQLSMVIYELVINWLWLLIYQPRINEVMEQEMESGIDPQTGLD